MNKIIPNPFWKFIAAFAQKFLKNFCNSFENVFEILPKSILVIRWKFLSYSRGESVSEITLVFRVIQNLSTCAQNMPITYLFKIREDFFPIKNNIKQC